MIIFKKKLRNLTKLKKLILSPRFKNPFSLDVSFIGIHDLSSRLQNLIKI